MARCELWLFFLLLPILYIVLSIKTLQFTKPTLNQSIYWYWQWWKNSRLILFFTFYIGCYLSYFRPFSSIVTSYLWKERKGWCFSFIFLLPRTVLLRSTVWYFLMALICFSVNFFVLYVYNKPWFGIQWETSYITDGNWLERFQWQIKWPIFHRILELGIPGLVCYLIWMDALMVICDSLANDWRRGIYL